MWNKKVVKLVCLIFCWTVAGPVQAFPPGNRPNVLSEPSRIQVQAMVDREPVRPGESFLLYLVVTVDEGWHIYSLHGTGDNAPVVTRVRLESNLFRKEGDWQESTPRLARDEVLGRNVKVHTRRVEFKRRLSVPPDLSPGEYPLLGTLVYRACNNKVCTLPRETSFSSRVIVK